MTLSARIPLSVLIGLSGLVRAQSQPGLFDTGRLRLVEEVRVTDANLPESALFQNPRGLAFDAAGNVYVTDFDANHIKVFGPDGKFRTTIGRKGQGPGELWSPSSLDVSGDRLVVWEVMNRRFSILNLKGELLKTAPTVHGPQGELMALRALPDGRFVAFVERGLPPQLQSRLPEERDYAVLLLDADLASLGAVFEKKILNRAWTRHPQTQGLIQIGFPFHPDVRMDVSPRGRLAIGLREKYEIGIYDPDKGKVADVARPYTPLKLEEQDRKTHFSSFRMVVFEKDKKTVVPKAPDYIVARTEFPEFLPPYRGLIYDGRGRLWVQVFTPDRKTNVFDVFSSEGQYLNRVAIEAATIDTNFTSAFEKRFRDDFLWKIERDEDGFASLVKYRLAPAR